MPSITASHRINGKYVGAQGHTPFTWTDTPGDGYYHGKTMDCSPPSFPFRPHQGVCDTPLQLAAKNLHEMKPSITASHRTNGKNVGAYRIRPPHRRTGQTMGTFTEKRWIARHHHSLFAHIRAYAIRPYSFWRKTFTNRCHPSPHPERQMVNMSGRKGIRPPWQGI